LLLLATIGFWILVEPKGKRLPKSSLSEKIRQFKDVLKEDANLRKYLYLINTTGVIAAMLPFLILFARQRFTVDGGLAGTFLLVQMAGSLGANIVLNLFSKDQRYRPLIYLFIGVSAATPIWALLMPADPMWYASVFLLSGISHTLNQILSSGILLEISTNENRAIYTGLSGAGSIMQVLYPLAAGVLVSAIGFTAVFIMSAIYILLGLYSARTITCTRLVINEDTQGKSV
jgi:MFS family permease